MSTATTFNPEMVEFVEMLQGWHESRVDELKLVIEQTDAEIAIDDKRIPADSDLAKGIRTGVQVALNRLGKLPFSVEKHDSEDEDDQDLEG